MTPALSQAARAFPLVPRTRPACRPIEERIREVTDFARTATEATAATDRLAAAAAAQNRAALIASDCGMPELAGSLCRQQFELFIRARPLTARTARYALEPLVNLSRLLMRAGNPEAACNQLEELYRAVQARESARIDGRELPFGELTGSGHEHRDLRQWLWGVMLADGVRALVTAGRWKQAAAFAQQYRGVGRRLLDGRQAAIITQALTGDPEAASAAVEQSAASEAWERAVAACLAMFCLRAAGRPPRAADTTPVQEYLALEPNPELATFRVRIALTALCLAGGEDPDDGASIVSRIVSEVPDVEDGYVARDLLRNPDLKGRFTAAQQAHLVSTVQSAGLGQGAIPEPLRTELLAAAENSNRATEELLRRLPAAQLP
ncbi:hypothetical protein [Spirillospora sp. NPDC048824]|uniref:hypothetical protein n=1 Tax=Spirillospora sp. NPDC048824 TaxID=3364526 RepID=UPI003713C4C3